MHYGYDVALDKSKCEQQQQTFCAPVLEVPYIKFYDKSNCLR